ncbi:MAG: M23 family metallopeptidase [Anaerolineales bacterium]|nr:M23 family metallopeptidase [Anaerolineales bacterium]
MAERIKSGWALWLVFFTAGIAIGLGIGWWLGGRQDAGGETAAESTTEVEPTATPEPKDTPAPTCAGDEVHSGLDAVLLALEGGDVYQADLEMQTVLAAYAGLIDRPECSSLSQNVLGIQNLVEASLAWEEAVQSGSIVQAKNAEQLAIQASQVTTAGRAKEIAEALIVRVSENRATMEALSDPGREIDNPQTIAAEQAGGLHPICEVNALIKPFLMEQSGSPAPKISRIAIYSDTLMVLAGGRLMMADLQRVYGPSPSVFLKAVDDGNDIPVVAGGKVGELVDMTMAVDGDLLLLEKTGRLLRRTGDGSWSLERQAEMNEMPVAVAPYNDRSYLLDPASNQIWRHIAGEEPENYTAEYFQDEAIRNVRNGVDMAIDGAVYVARYNGVVRRYYVGVEDSIFQPDTDLGVPTGIFLPDDKESTLVYVIDGEGRRLLGLNRESGAYRLGFAVNVQDVGSLTGGAISGGRLYLTDGEVLIVSIIDSTPVPSMDCPALPYPPVAPFDFPELASMNFIMPVDATIPLTPTLNPGGCWPSIGYGVLDGVVFSGLPFSSTVRSMADGTVSRIIQSQLPLSKTDMGIISTTHFVPSELNETLWGNQVWIDHGNGIETRYGGMAAIAPTVVEGQSLRRLAILGFVGQDPILMGIWVNGVYLGEGYPAQETVLGYQALFSDND